MNDLATINAADLPDPGEVPALDWIDVALIDADPLYQRPLDLNRVGTILRGFSWKSFGAVVVTPRAEGRFSVSDGQHRVEAAKQHPRVSHVPAVIVKAEDVPAEAAIFVGINRDRKNVTALELFFAQLAADDDGALTVFHTCSRAGIDIAKYPHASMKPRQTIAVAAVQALISKHGEAKARECLTVVVAGEFAPITAAQIRAAEYLLTDLQFASQVTADDVKAAIATIGTSLDSEAKRFAATHHCPLWQALASVWFQKCKKRRAPAATERIHKTESEPLRPHETNVFKGAGRVNPVEPLKATAWDMSQPVKRGASVTGALCGDPEPGRSALDQRRAGA